MALRLSVPWRTDGQWVLDAVLHADMCLRHLWVTWLLLLRMEQVQWVLKLACIAAKHVCRHLVFADYYATGAGPAHHHKAGHGLAGNLRVQVAWQRRRTVCTSCQAASHCC